MTRRLNPVDAQADEFDLLGTTSLFANRGRRRQLSARDHLGGRAVIVKLPAREAWSPDDPDGLDAA